MRLRQGMKFHGQLKANDRGVTRARKAAKRHHAEYVARAWVETCPDDPMVQGFAIVALSEKHAKASGGLTTASLLSVQAGRHCPPDVELATVVANVERQFAEAAE